MSLGPRRCTSSPVSPKADIDCRGTNSATGSIASGHRATQEAHHSCQYQKLQLNHPADLMRGNRLWDWTWYTRSVRILERRVSPLYIKSGRIKTYEPWLIVTPDTLEQVQMDPVKKDSLVCPVLLCATVAVLALPGFSEDGRLFVRLFVKFRTN
jgi:hypothetical protein